MREMIAAQIHQQWSSWMEYLFGKCDFNEDGTVTIPADLVLRWLRQKATEYHMLSESEKDSDRRQADKIISVLEEVE